MKKSIIVEFLYETLMLSISLVVGILVYIDFFVEASKPQQKIISNSNVIILLVFTFDYFYRLFKADNKIIFLKKTLLIDSNNTIRYFF